MKKYQAGQVSTIVAILVAVFAFALLLTFIITGGCAPKQPNDTAVPAPNYQVQNLEVLKSAQPNDVLLCVIENANYIIPKTQWAALVQENSDGKITIGQLEDHRMYLMTPKIPYSKLEQELGGISGCEIRIVPYGTGAAHDKLSEILMHGLNPR